MRKTIDICCAGNKVIRKMSSSRGGLTPTPPCVRPWSWPCDHCALCGCYAKHNKSMVLRVSQI